VLTGLKPVLAAFVAVFSFCFPSAAYAAVSLAKAAEREQLRKALTEVLQRPSLKNARVSFEVRSLDDGEVVFSHHPEDLLNPASNAKLFTAAVALVKLGPEYRFETEFFADQDYSAQQGKAKVLYVRGKGDPSITTERLYNLVSELWHAGLREVNGDLVIDESWFDAERTPPGFDQEDSDRAYMAPTGAVSLNWNAVGVYLRTGEGGKKPEVEVEPSSDYFEVENQLSVGPGRRYRRFTVASEVAGDKQKDKQKILVKGTLPAESSTVTVWKKIDNPPMYFGQTFKQMLLDRGIKVKGRVKVGLVPQGQTRMVYVAQSETFDVILKRMNKISSNFIAETLLKTVGAEIKGAPGSFSKGVDVAEDFLEKEVGIPRGTYVMKNGSGLNDVNRFSAAQISKLLRYMYDRFPLQPEYLSSMGIAGKDGTLRYRFEGSDAVGRLRAKTGTLESVSALSGYVQSVGGEKFIFSTMVNDFSGRAAPVVQCIDALGVAVAASGSAQGPGPAVAALTPPSVSPSPIEEAKARIKTYLALGKQGDIRNLYFLRTAWRSERDPAVRAVVAESLYRSSPQDAMGARALLDSLSANDEVYGRLRKVSREMAMDVPGVGSVVELAAEGNADALGRLLELARAASGDEGAERELSLALSGVARTAPEELLRVLKGAAPLDRDAAVGLMARGLVLSADAEHPFWPALRKAQGAVEPGLSAFARQLESALSVRIAQEKAPKAVPSAGAPVIPTPRPPATAETRPGG